VFSFLFAQIDKSRRTLHYSLQGKMVGGAAEEGTSEGALRIGQVVLRLEPAALRPFWGCV
jgi:hypothetical protein